MIPAPYFEQGIPSEAAFGRQNRRRLCLPRARAIKGTSQMQWTAMYPDDLGTKLPVTPIRLMAGQIEHLHTYAT